jgi:transposase
MAMISKKTVSGRRERQQERRFRAAELFSSGWSRAKVAAELNVTWRAAHTWWQQWQADGMEGLKAGNKPGPAPKFSDAQVEEIKGELAVGALNHGYPNELWTLRRVARLIADRFGLKASPSEVWRLLKRMGWSARKPQRKARERDEEKINHWKTVRWPELRAKAEQEERTIIFVDECGFSQKTTAKKPGPPAGKPRSWK